MDARTVRTLFLCVLFALGQVGAAVAQRAVTASPYTTVTGQSLAWAAPWTFVEDDAMQTADLDLVFLTDGTATVAVSTGGINPESARGLVIAFLGGDTNSVEFLDQGGGTASAYWFDAYPVDDEPFGAFSTATSLDAINSVLLMYIAPVASFGEGLASVQQGITLDGVPLFDGVDGMALQAQLGAPGGDPGAAGQAEFTPEGQWVDRTYDVQVAWDDTWFALGPDGDHAFRLGMPGSTVMLTVTVMPREGTTPQDWAEEQVRGREAMWGSYTFLPQYVGNDEVLTIGVHTSGQGGIVQEVLFLDDGETVVVVGVAILDGDPVEIAGTYRNSVRIDGRVPLEVVDLEAMARNDVSLYADAGVVEPGHFVGPQTGVDVQWSDAWQLDPNVSPPVETDPEAGSDLVNIDCIDDESLWITVLAMPSGGGGIDPFVDIASSPDWISQFGPDATVVHTEISGDRGVVLVKDTSVVPARMIYTELTLVDNGQTLLVVGAGGPLEQAGEGIRFVQETVTVNGEPVLGWYPVDGVLTWLGQ